jgi:hypothetical protein
MTEAAYQRNAFLHGPALPVEIVLAPAWWHRHAGIVFDEDFFFHPAKRVEAEQQMEQVLYERWGRFGLGADRGKDLPMIGAVHLAAGYLVSAMLGCAVEYAADTPPVVKPACRDHLNLTAETALRSPAYKKFASLSDALRTRHGGLLGDVNWGGVLNVALDLRGQSLFCDFRDQPNKVQEFLGGIRDVIEQLTAEVARLTGSTSISVNRLVRHFAEPVFLHSECSHTMISVRDYEQFLMPFDAAWSERRPFGIHYCGSDPHRYAEVFSRLPHLDFLDVGWGGDVAELRRHLPNTFLNIRYSPVEIARQTPAEIRATVRRLVTNSGNPWLTGVCCINMDQNVTDAQISALFEEAYALREQYAVEGSASQSPARRRSIT